MHVTQGVIARPESPAQYPSLHVFCLFWAEVSMPHRRGGEWMECCLKGYTVNKGQPNEARMYRIFDTHLRPDLLG